MATLNSPQLYRGMGFWNEATQQGIIDTHFADAGLGGMGYLAAVEMAKLGVGHFSLADPEVFDETNIGRVMGATHKSVGQYKVEVCANEILENNPDAEITVFKDGVNEANVKDFLTGAHLVLDATELSMPELGTMVCREARRIGAVVLNGEYLAHAGQVTAFTPDGMTFEKFMGLKGTLDEIKGVSIPPERYMAYLPPYGDLKTLAAITPPKEDKKNEAQRAQEDDIAPLPSNIIGVGVATQLVLAEAIKHIRLRVGEPVFAPPVVAPHVQWLDPSIGRSGHTRHPKLSFYRHAAVMGFNNLIGHYDRGSYTTSARAARGDIG